MTLSEQTPVIGDWFYLHFIENPGMAFGWKFWGEKGKILLTSFRIVAAIGIAIYILRLIKKGLPNLSLVFFSLILAGAMGNIVDSIFYGQWFTRSTLGEVAVWANEGGYSPYFQGYVVDMLYFPLIETHWPDWMPVVGGKRLEFFRPVFNIADASITIGVIGMLLFQRGVFAKELPKEEEKVEGEAETDAEDGTQPIAEPEDESPAPDIEPTL